MESKRTYTIVSRYLVAGEGWKHDEVQLEDTTYEAAGRAASQVARSLDRVYGDGHFWTVDLEGENGSYFQLFHGRLY